MDNICSNDIKKIWMESSGYLCKKVIESYIPGKHFYYVFNMENLQYEWLSDTIEDVLGYHSTDLNILLVFDNIHPQDQIFHAATENKLQALSEENGEDWLNHYKIMFDFRFKNCAGQYIRLLKQMIQVYDEELGCRKRYGLITDISHLKKSGEPILNLIGLDGYPSMEDIPLCAERDYPCPFSKRELEIISLIFQGLTSKEIADHLCISPDTVKNHKKNIFSKAIL